MSNYKEVGTCCLCGNIYTHWGNNPWPLSDNLDDRCCDECNDFKVIPARIEQMYKKGE